MTKDSADDLLYRWGVWSWHHFGLGYPRENTIGRVMREGPGAGHSSVKADIPMPDDIALAERAVLKMEAETRKAIKCKYILKMTDKDGSKRCRCGRTEYRNRLDQGIMFLAGMLAAG